VATAAPRPDAIVVMARVLAPYGVHGWVRLRPFSGEPDALLGYARWWVRPVGADAWQEVGRIGGRMHSGAVLAEIEGIATREAALALRGAEVGVPRSSMPALKHGEIYWTDLVGLDVVNREGARLGQVVAVQDYGAHPVLRVASGNEATRTERLVPFVAAHVDRVDLPARRIEVDWQPDY